MSQYKGLDFISSIDIQKQFLVGWNSFIKNKVSRPIDLSREVFRIGSGRLLDYGGDGDEIVLIIPSLINRYYILDLSESNSLVEYLKSLNYRVYVIEWGMPISDEYSFNLGGYVIERIIPFIDFIQRIVKGRVLLLGYCLGGTLALMTTLIVRQKIKGVILIATPWNFSKMLYLKYNFIESYTYPIILAEQVRRFFCAIDHDRVIKKFITFGSLDGQEEQYSKFLEVESWLEDGIAVTKEVLKDIEALNRDGFIIFRNHRVGGEVMCGEGYDFPKLAIISLRDKIIPFEAASPVVQALNTTSLVIDAGHIGVLINKQAQKILYESIGDWISYMRGI
jgi:polyhydroxyalkanoate synthase